MALEGLGQSVYIPSPNLNSLSEAVSTGGESSLQVQGKLQWGHYPEIFSVVPLMASVVISFLWGREGSENAFRSSHPTTALVLHTFVVFELTVTDRSLIFASQKGAASSAVSQASLLSFRILNLFWS